MQIRALKHCLTFDRQNKRFGLFLGRHSWVWNFSLCDDLQARPGVLCAVFSACCFRVPDANTSRTTDESGSESECGVERCWLRLLANSRALTDAEHKPVCSCGYAEDEGEIMELSDGTFCFQSEVIRSFPQALVERIRDGILQDFRGSGKFNGQPSWAASRVWVSKELGKAGKRFRCNVRKAAAVERLSELEEEMQPGREPEHLAAMVRRSHYRSTDVRLMARTPVDAEEMLLADPLREVPYP